MECSINMVMSPQAIESGEERRSFSVCVVSLDEQVGDPQWNEVEPC